jgi:CheY-like chemotaxis protein
MRWESGADITDGLELLGPILPTGWIWAASHIERVLAESGPPAGVGTRSTGVSETLPGFHKTVFVAEDDDAMREAVSTALRSGGYEILEARDGAELLDLLLNAVEHPALRPHVVVADVRMPKLSGLGVLATLRRASWNIPVLLITALTDDSVRTVARRLGAIGVLRKPFDMAELLTAVLNAGALPRDGHAS